MARRKSSMLDDLVEVAAILPWWVGVLLAGGSYLVLHYFAVMEASHPQGMKDFGHVVGTNVTKIFATFLQYLVPLALCLGAVLSGKKQWQRKNLFKNQISLMTIQKLNWKQFEIMISEAFREKGYQVTETADGPDGGVDLVLMKGGKKFFVQCKHWKKTKVGVKEVRELNGIVAAKSAYGGILVTSGTFTSEALEFAEVCHIELIDGKELNQLIPHLEEADQIDTPISTTPNCPKCGSKMVKRTAKKGPKAGNEFWGCTFYPKCKGTLDIRDINQEYAK